MNVLEKILEALEKRVNFRKTLVKYEKKMGTITDVARNQGALEELVVIANIIDSCVNKVKDDWIPCSERLPEVSEGIEDDYCPEFNVTIKGADKATTLKCAPDGTWFDDSGEVYNVIAWKPLPEAYRVADDSKPDWKEHILNTFLAGH